MFVKNNKKVFLENNNGIGGNYALPLLAAYSRIIRVFWRYDL